MCDGYNSYEWDPFTSAAAWALEVCPGRSGPPPAAVRSRPQHERLQPLRLAAISAHSHRTHLTPASPPDTPLAQPQSSSTHIVSPKNNILPRRNSFLSVFLISAVRFQGPSQGKIIFLWFSLLTAYFCPFLDMVQFIVANNAKTMHWCLFKIEPNLFVYNQCWVYNNDFVCCEPVLHAIFTRCLLLCRQVVLILFNFKLRTNIWQSQIKSILSNSKS